ncbi:GINS complex subunit Sld5 [Pyrobaculum neutrophilum]|uniref:GINS complex subunit Sld5 n=1 Tax=Pyrobaculum neutrophilum TaxID=70771 RepID=UPI00164EF33A
MYGGVVGSYPVRVAFKKDVDLPLLGVSHKAGTEAEVPLYLALKLDEMGAVEIDESGAIQPRDVTSLKYVEQRESYPVKLPEGFYARVKLAAYIFNKRGDVKSLRTLVQEVRELVIERVRKIAVLVATRPDIINDQSFLDRLTAEERALLTSIHASVTSFALSII